MKSIRITVRYKVWDYETTEPTTTGLLYFWSDQPALLLFAVSFLGELSDCGDAVTFEIVSVHGPEEDAGDAP